LWLERGDLRWWGMQATDATEDESCGQRKKKLSNQKKKSETHITKAKNPGSEQIHNIQLGLKGD